METIAFRMDRLPELAVMRKWWEYMADIMQTAPGHTPLQEPLVPVFELQHSPN